VVDEGGGIAYRDLDHRTDRIAGQLRAAGAAAQRRIGVLGRNDRGFVEALVGAAKTGADVVLVNAALSPSEVAGVVADEEISILLHGDDFAETAAGAGAEMTFDASALAEMASENRVAGPSKWRPPKPGRLVLLTSGTTGRPKGAVRRGGFGAAATATAIASRVPLRVRDVQVVAAPLFHGWGLTHLLLGLSRAATTVLSPRFDPGSTLTQIADTDARVLVAVPVMLQRILELGPQALLEADVESVQVIASSGSALGPTLARQVLDRFGPVLYNLYGSTEVAVATIATPQDLDREPGTAGRVALGSRVEILDEQGAPLPAGVTGRVFVGNASRFEGYTSGGGKEQQRGLLSSGDLGHFDERGLLFIDGRVDDMIVSGGENVFPAEVEELLAGHPAVAEVAVVGVDDDQFGQVLAAFVVPRHGADLTVDDMRNHVRQRLAGFKVPRRVVFVSELPRTSTGKVLRRALVAS
jgi:fatty-acyl-CoA synthase